MKKTSEIKAILRRMVLLMMAGAAAGLVLTDALNKVQLTATEIRAAYDPFMHFKMSGRTVVSVLPRCAAVSARFAQTLWAR